MLPDFEQNRSWLRSDPSPVFPEKGEWLWEQMLEYLPDSVLVPKIDETIYVMQLFFYDYQITDILIQMYIWKVDAQCYPSVFISKYKQPLFYSTNGTKHFLCPI